MKSNPTRAGPHLSGKLPSSTKADEEPPDEIALRHLPMIANGSSQRSTIKSILRGDLMLSIRSTSLVVFIGIASAISCGCGEQPRPVKSDTPTLPSKIEIPLTVKPVAKAPAEPKVVSPQQKLSKPFREAEFISDRFVAVFVAHPKQFVSSPVGQLVAEYVVGPGGENLTEFKLGQLKIQAVDVERVTYVLDQITIDRGAREMGLTVVGDEAPKSQAVRWERFKIQLGNRFKLAEIGLAFQKYHDEHHRFPRADGNASGNQTGLSWRVHLLPYLDQADLYSQFHLDEPWDSDHNKTLIAQIPDFFRSPDSEDREKTSIHVFTGENTSFHGEKGIEIPDFIDGTSNTILGVLAGSDKAEIWTKPGGLEVDLSSPTRSLGELQDEEFLVLFADGAAGSLPTEIDDTTLASLIQPADGNIVHFDEPGRFFTRQPPLIELPNLIISLVNDANQEEFLKTIIPNGTRETHEGQAFRKDKKSAVWFPDSKTVIVGSIESVKQMISAKTSGKASNSPLIDQLQLEADFTSAANVESQSDLMIQSMEMNSVMEDAVGLVTAIKRLSIKASASGQEGDPILQVNVIANDISMAAQLANMFLAFGKEQLTKLLPAKNDAEQEVQEFVIKVVSSAEVTQEGDTVRLIIPTPADFNELPQILRPALETAEASRKKNTFKEIGLAMHNFHDGFRTFPGAGRMCADKPVGLSWRVYLLPFLEQGSLSEPISLFNQFERDEPWDSPHNKQLIAKMPHIYRSPGVDEPGKTSVHVFTGPGTPFANDHSPALSEFTHGPSKTFLVVQAGADKADFWTKPGGLDFDPDNPIKALGEIAETFMVLFANGSVRIMSKDIEPEKLRSYIQHGDGNQK